jgi:SAM-dependent methyltransferase
VTDKPKLPEGASAQTLAFYDQNAQAFWARTRDHDVRHNIAALVRFIESKPPFRILDFGCGPGRDLKAFRELGHEAIGLEGSKPFAEMASAHSGCEVWVQDFLKLDLPPERFDGIFANASLFHVPPQELPRVLGELGAALKPRGVLFSSNPHGADTEETSNDGRYGAYHSPDVWRRYMREAGFSELTHFFRPQGLPREQQPWFASVWRK